MERSFREGTTIAGLTLLFWLVTFEASTQADLFPPYKKRPATTFARATADPYRTNCNLSAAIDPYGTYDNRCSTITDTYGACNNLSATANPWAVVTSRQMRHP